MFKGWMENNKATKETQKVQAGIGRKVGITLKDSSPKTKKGKKKKPNIFTVIVPLKVLSVAEKSREKYAIWKVTHAEMAMSCFYDVAEVTTE